jgi:hypothetical protein
VTVDQVLQSEFANSFYNGMTADDAFAAFTAGRSVTTTEQQLKPFTVGEVLSLCGQGSLAKLLLLPCLTDIRDKIQQNDREGVMLWGTVLTAGGVITQGEAEEIAAVCQATESVEVETVEDPRVFAAFAGKADFPNMIDRAQFDAAWAAAGRS